MLRDLLNDCSGDFRFRCFQTGQQPCPFGPGQKLFAFRSEIVRFLIDWNTRLRMFVIWDAKASAKVLVSSRGEKVFLTVSMVTLEFFE